MSSPKLVVLGMGPVGCILAAHLAKGNSDVTAIDAFHPRVNAIRKEGIEIRGIMNLEATIPRVLSSLEPLEDEKIDTLFVSLKATTIASILPALERIYHPGITLVSFQNGLDTEEIFAGHFGKDGILRFVINFAGNLITESKIKSNFSAPPNYIGCINDKTVPAAKETAALLTRCGLETEFTEDIKKHVWQKVILNAILAPVTAITGLTMKEACDFQPTFHLVQELTRESIAVAKELGYDFGDGFYDWCLNWLAKTGYHKPSMLVDMEAGVATEIDFLNGAIARLAGEKGLPNQANLFVANLIKGMYHKCQGGSFQEL